MRDKAILYAALALAAAALLLVTLAHAQDNGLLTHDTGTPIVHTSMLTPQSVSPFADTDYPDVVLTLDCKKNTLLFTITKKDGSIIEADFCKAAGDPHWPFEEK